MRDSQRDLSIRESGVQGFEMRCSVPEASKRDYILMQDLVNTAVFKTFLIVIFHQWVGSCSGLTPTTCSKSFAMPPRRGDG